MNQVARAESSVVTRRQFLRYSTATVGGLACAGFLGPFGDAASLAAASGTSLAPERRASVVAVIEALDGVVPGVEAARADQAVTALVTRYQDETPDLRRNIDLVLDALDPDSWPGRFAQMGIQDRRRVLEDAWLERGEPRLHAANAQPIPRVALIQDATALVVRSLNLDLDITQ